MRSSWSSAEEVEEVAETPRARDSPARRDKPREVVAGFGSTAPHAQARGSEMAPQVGLEPTTLRLTAECSTIELLRNLKEPGLPARADRAKAAHRTGPVSPRQAFGIQRVNLCP